MPRGNKIKGPLASSVTDAQRHGQRRVDRRLAADAA